MQAILKHLLEQKTDSEIFYTIEEGNIVQNKLEIYDESVSLAEDPDRWESRNETDSLKSVPIGRIGGSTIAIEGQQSAEELLQTGPNLPLYSTINLNVSAPRPNTPTRIQPAFSMPTVSSTRIQRLNIPGPRDDALREYCEWQQSNVKDYNLLMAYSQATNLALAEGLDLEQLHGDQDPNFLIDNGVAPGVARRFVGDIGEWVKWKMERETRWSSIDDMGKRRQIDEEMGKRRQIDEEMGALRPAEYFTV
jgi:hypothetical protein